MKVILRVQIKMNPWQKLSKSAKNRGISSDENDIPLMKLAKRMQQKDKVDELGNDDTSAEDQRSINEVNSFN